MIVDPADQPQTDSGQCRQLSLTPAAILLTHGHFDHIGAAEEICREYPAEVIAGEKEDQLMRDPIRNLSSQFGSGFTAKASRLVKRRRRDFPFGADLGRLWRLLDILRVLSAIILLKKRFC